MDNLTSPSWISFLNEVKKAKKELGNPDIIWYRGHADYSFYLLPTLLRYKNGIDKEKELFHKFKKFSHRVFELRSSEWETLFDMQHYGIPTRLLDWTESFGIGLYFAAQINHSRKSPNDAALYLLNPEELNSKSVGKKILRIPEDENSFSYSKIYWNHNPFSPNAPIAVEPLFRNDRIFAQRGMFTVHDDDITPIETKFPDVVKKIILPNDAIPAAIDFLNLANINEYSVFPDLAGIADYLTNDSGLISRWKRGV